MSLRRAAPAALRSEAGMAGAGIAAIAGALVLTASLVGGVMVTSGFAGSEQLDNTVQRALARVATGVQVDAPVLARTDGTRATVLLVDVTTTAAGGPVPLAGAGGAETTLRVRYISRDTAVPDLPYTVTWLSGNGDAALEPGEVAELAVDVSGVEPPIAASTAFTLELRPGDGVTTTLARTMPAGRPLDPVVNLW